MVKSFRDLFIWRTAVELATSISALVTTFPGLDRWTIGQQMLRSSVSVASNIAEGWGRRSSRDFCQFLGIARGSLCELEIASRNGLVKDADRSRLSRLISLTSTGISRLMKRL